MIEGPYKLPEGWRWVRLGEVCELLVGRTPRKEEYLNQNIGTKVLKFRDITEDGTISWTNHVAGYVKSEFAGRIAQIGDVILTAAAHTPEQIGRKVAYLATIPEEIPKVYFTAELMVLRADKNLLDGRWLTFWLQSEEGHKQIQAHVKEKHLVKTRAKEISLPLPPLEEQQRIVAKVEALMARVREAKRLRRQAKEDAERLWQAALAETFPRPGAELPAGWRWVRLGEVCEIASGGTPKRGVPAYWGGNIPWVKISDIPADGWVSHTEETITIEGLSSSSAKIFPEGTLLFSIFATVGKVGILRIKAATNQAIAGLKVIRSDIDRLYLFYALRRVAERAKTAGRGMAQDNINLSILRGLTIPFPPLQEQRRIVAHLEAVQEKIRALKSAQSETDEDLNRLEQAILDKAFQGEL